ncbi:FAD-binding protein [Halalkaliarchaeum sp. AArc-GB]|uniref:UDP-N-acetylmuramate dehydrogenase n=1 Tax=Halalkaliarchaeum sp. AArc-GB TaxID=3074078 RepID=UPI002862F174|nr:FAD-binding protein [Halalkaliarchaeum sp. AArc-GB]MDR5674236.1 FAD-binding protein [Halalkaliarchaeum sp. AArc-GB]
MEEIVDELSNHTWIKIGGSTKIMLPNSKEELVDAIDACNSKDQGFRILGNGSNVLPSDNGLDEIVIKSTHACTDLELLDDTTVRAGASVMLPQFVNFCVQNDLGGPEYLYSVPGTIGGGIHMNAGRGYRHDKSISDFVHSVEIYDGSKIRTLSRNELEFDHRYSTFQDHPDWVILSATFELPPQDSDIGKKKIQERMEIVKNRDRSTPSLGSIFAFEHDFRLPMQGIKIGDAKFVSDNRIGNLGNATQKDVKRLIYLKKTLYRLIPFVETPRVEVRIWD